MKKLMIMAGAVIMAAAVQAASCNWSANNVYSYDGTTFTKASATVKLAGYLFVDATASTISTALAKGDTSVLDGAVVPLTTNNMGIFTGGTPAEGYSEGSHTAFAVIFSGSDATSSKYFYITDPMEMELSNSGNTTYTFGNLATAMQTKGNWTQATAAPEPTSGLLLLLGMAGLALKRKRA